MEVKAERAIKHYEQMLRASRNYWNRKKQEKIKNGTYRDRGRPRKNPLPEPPVVEVVQKSI